MEAAKQSVLKKKIVFKSCATRLSAVIDAFDNTEANADDLKRRLCKFEERHREFRVKFDALVDLTNEEDVDEQMAHFHEVDELFHKVCDDIQNCVRQREPKVVLAISPSPSSSSTINVKLPMLELPKFSGKIEEWISFHDLFESLINKNKALTDLQRFHYLRSCLKGEAAQAIMSLSISEINYNVAWTTLCNQFDNKKPIIETHLKQLCQLPVVEVDSADSIGNCTHNITQIDPLSEQLTKFWEVESVHAPICIPMTLEQHKSEGHFKETVRRDQDGTFIVQLPFNDNLTNLGSSKQNSLYRFRSLERKLIKNSSSKIKYSEFMSEYENLGHMSQVIDDTTKLRVAFDESVPSDICTTWNKYTNDTSNIEGVSIPRQITNLETSSRTLDSLNFDIVGVNLWSDSTIVLPWRRSSSSSSMFKIFVANQISEIPSAVYRHVSTAENPANIISRERTPTELLCCKSWWDGPSHLRLPSNQWPILANNTVSDPLPKLKTSPVQVLVSSEPCFLLNKYSTSSKLRKVVAYCMRFHNNYKDKLRVTGALTVDELETASAVILRCVQAEVYVAELELLKQGKPLLKSSLLSFNPFVGPDRLLRVGGRLHHAHLTYNQRHPIILPLRHHVTAMIIHFKHLRHLHAGARAILAALRYKYWPIGGKNAVMSLILKCMRCCKTYEHLMGDLPASRINLARAVSRSGLDFCEPLHIKADHRRRVRTSKAYVAVFVCIVSKAMHLVLVCEMITLLVQIEACLNSRPLLPLSQDIDDLDTINPGHFLIGKPLAVLPKPSLVDIKCNKLSHWQRVQQLFQYFWKKWSDEYLRQLQPRTKWKVSKAPLDIGALVTIRDMKLPPLRWRLGRVLEFHPGKDLISRVATIRTSSGTVKVAMSSCATPL